jgi:hypothetical protein
MKRIANPFSVRLRGTAVIPKPWTAIDPVANGVRVVIDGITSSGGIDVAIPGGVYNGVSGWKINGAGTSWRYIDKAGSAGGITRAVVTDRSRSVDGMIRWSVSGKSIASVSLPSVDDARTTFVAGAADECATIEWNPPAGERPRCTGDTTRLICR